MAKMEAYNKEPLKKQDVQQVKKNKSHEMKK